MSIAVLSPLSFVQEKNAPAGADLAPARIPCGQALTLGDLVHEMGPALKAVSLPSGWQRSAIAWANLVDSAYDLTMIAPESVVLITQKNLPSGVELTRLVDDLRSADATALIVEISPNSDRLSPALVRRAEAVGLPVFELNSPATLRDMVSGFYRSNGTSETRLLKRISLIQRGFLDALAEENAENALLTRISRSCSAVASVFSGGDVVATTGLVPELAISRHLIDQPRIALDWRDGTRQVFAIPVDRPHETHAWLVVVARSEEADVALVRAVVRMAAPLFTAVARLSNATSRQQREAGGAVLHTLLHEQVSHNLEMAERQAAGYGIHISDGVTMTLVAERLSPTGRRASTIAAIASTLEGDLLAGGVDHLLLRREHDIVLLTQGSFDDVEDLLLTTLRAHKGAETAVSGMVDSPACLQRAVREANLLLHSHRDDEPSASKDPSVRLRHISDLTLTALISAQAASDDIRVRAAEMLAPILKNPILYEALGAIMESSFDVPRASKVLQIHTNTMRYRLERIERILGGSLHDPLVISDIVLARLATR